MSKADMFEQVAETLRKTAGTYTTKSSLLQTQSQGLTAVVQNLVTGADRWAGSGSLAFQGSFSRAQGDYQNIISALTQASGSLNSMAQIIEDNLPAIRSYESYVQSESAIPSMPPSAAKQFQQELQTAQQLSAMADMAISLMADAMSAQVDAAAQEVGVCSTGDGQGSGQGGDTNYARLGRKGPDGKLRFLPGESYRQGWKWDAVLAKLITSLIVGALNYEGSKFWSKIVPGWGIGLSGAGTFGGMALLADLAFPESAILATLLSFGLGVGGSQIPGVTKSSNQQPQPKTTPGPVSSPTPGPVPSPTPGPTPRPTPTAGATPTPTPTPGPAPSPSH